MAKRVDPLKAKEAKQKKIAIAGGVLLLALLGVQGPKTLKMLQGPQPVATAAATTPTTSGAAVPTPAPATGGTAAPAASGATADLASVTDSDVAPTIEPGRLATFERFSSKDPFTQQAEPVPVETPAAKPNDGAKPDPGAAAKPAGAQPGGGAPTSTGGFTTGGGTGSGSEPDAPKLAEATSISINGVAEDVAVEAEFPKEEPTFVLVSIAANGKSVEIGIAGGEYADGGETMKLTLGRKLTLQNTADGSRYELELLTIEGRPVPKPKK